MCKTVFPARKDSRYFQIQKNTHRNFQSQMTLELHVAAEAIRFHPTQQEAFFKSRKKKAKRSIQRKHEPVNS